MHAQVSNPHKSRMETDLWTVLKSSEVERWVRALMYYGIRAWADGDATNAGEHMEAETKSAHNQEQIGWSHFLRGKIIEDWATVINKERVNNELPVLTWANIKGVCKITPIVLDLWWKRCKLSFGKTRKSKIKNQRELLSRKIEKLLEIANTARGRGCIHFENPPWEGTSLSLMLMKTWPRYAKQHLSKYCEDNDKIN